MKGHTSYVKSIAVTADGRFLVSASIDKSIKIWNINEQKEECSLIGHTSDIYTVALSPDERFIVSGAGDKKIKLWNLQGQMEECILKSHEKKVGQWLSVQTEDSL